MERLIASFNWNKLASLELSGEYLAAKQALDREPRRAS